MNDEFFVDTNILVYAFDESEKPKRIIAKKIIEEVTKGNAIGFISNQVLAEFFVALTKKIENPLNKTDAEAIVNGFIDSVHWKKINYSDQTVSKAIETSIKTNSHFWDALIAEAMLENKIYVLLTENTKDFKCEHIKTINPFKSWTKINKKRVKINLKTKQTTN